MEFRRETLFDVIEEVQPLLDLHYEELCVNRDTVKLNPRWDVYRDLEGRGALVIYTARDNAKLVGYSAYLVNQSLHYADLKVAQNDVFYITQDHRRGAMPYRFLKFCEKSLAGAGVQKLVYHCKTTNQLSPLLHRIGYDAEEVMVAKLL